MNKQERIDAMTRVLDGSNERTKQAIGLYNEGYRKVPENMVLISKEKLLEIANDYEEMAAFHIESIKEIEQAQKQGIAEFVKRLKDLVSLNKGVQIDGCEMLIKFAEEIAKKRIWSDLIISKVKLKA